MAVDAAEISNASRDVSSSHAVRGIDTLRFFAAAWVALYHGGAFPVERLLPPQLAMKLPSLGRLPFNGVAAVVVFFVISGFCIHYHNVGKVRLSWLRFLVQRAVRIIPPFACVVILAHQLGPDFSRAVRAVLWSIYCEIAYYALYPLIFLIIAKGSLRLLICVCAAVSFVLACMWPKVIFLGDMGDWTWAFCLPMWLAGCLLAEQYQKSLSHCDCGSGSKVWIYRLGAICIGAFAAILSHLPVIPIGYIWSMPAFAIYCVAWMSEELHHARNGGTVRTFERLGTAAYSIYLTHKLAICAVEKLQADWLLSWILNLAGIAAMAAIFYFLVERPSHQVSKWIGRRMKNAVAAPVQMVVR